MDTSTTIEEQRQELIRAAAEIDALPAIERTAAYSRVINNLTTVARQIPRLPEEFDKETAYVGVIEAIHDLSNRLTDLIHDRDFSYIPFSVFAEDLDVTQVSPVLAAVRIMTLKEAASKDAETFFSTQR